MNTALTLAAGYSILYLLLIKPLLDQKKQKSSATSTTNKKEGK